MCWESVRPGGTNHAALLDELTAMIAGAQAADGYLHTAFGRPGQPGRYSDLNFGHELYCAGHLLQAAWRAARTGRRRGLLDVASAASPTTSAHVRRRRASAGTPRSSRRSSSCTG